MAKGFEVSKSRNFLHDISTWMLAKVTEFRTMYFIFFSANKTSETSNLAGSWIAKHKGHELVACHGIVRLKVNFNLAFFISSLGCTYLCTRKKEDGRAGRQADGVAMAAHEQLEP